MLEEQKDQEGLRFAYDQLRKEVLHNDTLNIQILGFILVLHGGIISFSAAIQGFLLTKGVMFFFVLGVAFIGLMQSIDRGGSIYKLAAYLRTFVEPYMEYMQWETRLQEFRNIGDNRLLGYVGYGGFTEYQLVTYTLLIIIDLVLGCWNVVKRASIVTGWPQINNFDREISYIALVVASILFVATLFCLWVAFIHYKKVMWNHDKNFTPIWHKIRINEIVMMSVGNKKASWHYPRGSNTEQMGYDTSEGVPQNKKET